MVGDSSAHQNDDLKGGLWLGFTWYLYKFGASRLPVDIYDSK
jgi:hypothetical protein